MPGRARNLVVFALMAILLDVAVALTALIDWRSFSAAPNNDFLVPGDDPDYFLAGLAYAGASALRYLALLCLIVAILRCRIRASLLPGADPLRGLVRRRLAIAGLLVAIELGYVALTWRAADATGAWCLARVSTVIVSAIVVAAVVVSIRRIDAADRRYGLKAG